MKHRVITSVVILAMLSATIPALAQTRPNHQSVTAIRAVLDAQAAAWNRGDLEGYMEGYQRSPDIVFISGDRVTRGWKTVLKRYKRSYDTREKMGVLKFSDVEITMLSPDAALVFGRWQLRTKDSRAGASRCCSEEQGLVGESFTITLQARDPGARHSCPHEREARTKFRGRVTRAFQYLSGQEERLAAASLRN